MSSDRCSYLSETPPSYSNESPPYMPSLEYYGLSLLRMEFETPWSDNYSSLKPVVVELNSNQMNIYEFLGNKSIRNTVMALFKHQNYCDDMVRKPDKSDISDGYYYDCDAYGQISSDEPSSKPVLTKLRKHFGKKMTQRSLSSSISPEVLGNNLLFEPTSDNQTYNTFAKQYRGKLLYTFTLSNIVVGEAPSFISAHHKEDKPLHTNSYALTKYRNTLRLRVEYTQILLHFWSFYGMVHWYRNICVGRDLTSPIESRKTNLLKSIPRNFSAVNNALLEATSREATLNGLSCTKAARRPSESSSDEASEKSCCFSETSADSKNTDSLRSRSSSVYSSEPSPMPTIDVYGSKIVCMEDFYSSVEKQYVSNCIPDLNSYDKWVGSRLTISSFQNFLPKDDKANLNSAGQVFISPNTFNSLVRNYYKSPHLSANDVKSCRDYMVVEEGLVGLN